MKRLTLWWSSNRFDVSDNFLIENDIYPEVYDDSKQQKQSKDIWFWFEKSFFGSILRPHQINSVTNVWLNLLIFHRINEKHYYRKILNYIQKFMNES